MENDDKLKALFDGFKPEMTSDDDFMRRLESKLDTVDMVKSSLRKERRISRRALVAAVMTGIVTGLLLAVGIGIASPTDMAATVGTAVWGGMLVTPSMLSLSFGGALATCVALAVYPLVLFFQKRSAVTKRVP